MIGSLNVGYIPFPAVTPTSDSDEVILTGNQLDAGDLPNIQTLQNRGVSVAYDLINSPPEITLTDPTGGEVWSNSQNITWDASDSDEDSLSIYIFYSADEGSSWNTVSANEENDGSYSWDTSSVGNGSQYRTKIEVSDGQTTVSDSSTSNFTIENVVPNNPPVTTLSDPTGGENWSGTQNITWTATDADQDTLTIDIYYSSDEGSTWNSVASDEVNDGAYAWNTVTLNNGLEYRIKIEADDGQTTDSDESSSNITLHNNRTPEISLTAPNGGETWTGTQNITWSADDEDQDTLTIDIYYSTDGGSTWNIVTSNEDNDGSYSWNTFSLSNGSDYRIKVEADDTQATDSDESASNFTVYNNHTPEITLTAPTGGETWTGNQDITWNATDVDEDTLSIDIFYSADSGSTWNTIASDETNDGIHSWDSASVLNGSNYRIKVEVDDTQKTGTDSSASDFTIQNNHSPTITLTSPTGDESWTGMQSITWNASDVDEDALSIDIYYSSDNGNSWQVLSSDEDNDGTYSFNTISYSNDTDYKIKVVADDGALSSSDESTNPFTITNTTPEITLTAPSDGSTLNATQAITWSATDSDGNNLTVDIFYSANSGDSWVSISSDEPDDGTYSWDTTTVSDGTAYRIKLVANDGKVTSEDSSDNDFTITNNPPEITLTAPTGGETWNGTQAITWNTTDSGGETLSIDILYSSDGGNTWNSLATGETDDGSFSWDTLSITGGTSFKLKVTVSDGVSQAESVSDTVFTVDNSHTVIKTINVGDKPYALAVDPSGTNLYVTNGGDDTVSKIQISNHTVSGSIDVGDRPEGIAIEPNAIYMYVSNANDDAVSVVRLSDSSVIKTVSVGNHPWGMVAEPNGDYIYVANGGAAPNSIGTVSVIQISNNTVIKTIELGQYRYANSIAANPNGFYVYTSNYSNGNVGVILVVNNTLVDTITHVAYPYGIAVEPEGNYIYISDEHGDKVEVVQTSDYAIVETIDVGGSPYDVAADHTGNFIYVANKDDGTISVIQTSDNTVIKTVSVGGRPEKIAVEPNDHYVYVANYDDDTVSVIRISP